MKTIIIKSKKHGVHRMIVDDEDYLYAKSKTWTLVKGNKKDRFTFYASTTKRIGSKLRHYYLHRILTHAKKGFEVDHINGKGLDNRKKNLRVCRRKQNARNAMLSTSSTSGYKGVSYRKQRQKYQAQIKVNYKYIYLGLYINVTDAAKAYNAAAVKYFGKYSRLNNI